MHITLRRSWANLRHIGTLHNARLIGGQAEVWARYDSMDLLVELRANGGRLRIPFGCSGHITDPMIIEWAGDYLNAGA